MNCRQFQDKLFEYVEGSLSGDELAEARQHCSLCNACQELVQKELQLKDSLSARLQQDAKTLTLRPEIARNVLAASCAARPAGPESLAGLWMRWLRLAAIPASLLVIVAGVLAVRFFSTPTRPVESRIWTGYVSTPTNYRQPEVSVEMSYRVPVHKFHQEGNLVVDAFVDESVVINGVIPSGSLSVHQ